MSEINDLFYLESVYPEAAEIFSFDYKSLEAITENCVYVFDTNVLLVPFNTNEKNLDDIKSILLKLKKQSRLFLPARAAREFAKNRASRLGDLFLKIRQTKNKLNSEPFKIENYLLLNFNETYLSIQNNFGEIRKLINDSKKLLEKLESDVLSWNWDDNVSKIYREIFTSEVIKEVKKTDDELAKDLAYRIKYKIPPGYKDSNKLDDGIGDLIIWQTAMEIAHDQNADLVIVSNDQKNDWFYKQDNTGLYPRYELFDEFRRFSGGKSMHIIDFPKFLELRNAQEDTIAEVRENVFRSRVYRNPKFSKDLLTKGLMIEHSKFGVGKILSVEQELGDEKITVNFDDYGMKQLLFKFSPIKLVNNSHNSNLLNSITGNDVQDYNFFDVINDEDIDKP